MVKVYDKTLLDIVDMDTTIILQNTFTNLQTFNVNEHTDSVPHLYLNIGQPYSVATISYASPSHLMVL